MKRGPMNTPDPALVDVSTASRLLGISNRHLVRLASQGAAPAPRKLGRAVRWCRQELMTWLEAGCPTTQSGK